MDPAHQSSPVREDFRAEAGNFVWLVLEKCVRLVLSLVVGFWVARYLGPERFGVLSYWISLVALLSVLPALGMDEILKRRLIANPEAGGQLLLSALLLRIGMGMLVYGALVVIVLSSDWVPREEVAVSLLTGLLLLQPALLLPDLWLQVRLQARLSSVAQMGALAVSAGLRVALIRLEAEISVFAAVAAIEMLLSACGLWLLVRREGFRLRIPPAAQMIVRQLLSQSLPLLVTSFAVMIYMRIDELMLRQLLGAEAVGIYSAAVRLSEVAYFIPVALASTALPRLLRTRERSSAEYRNRVQATYDLNAGAAYVFVLGTTLFGSGFVHLSYGAAFVESGEVLNIHVWAGLFVFLGVARGQWLLNEGLARFYLLSTLAGAVCNVAFNWILIPRAGVVGAAWATLISYGVAAWLSSFFHPAVRPIAWMQLRALLIPFRAWTYLRSR